MKRHVRLLIVTLAAALLAPPGVAQYLISDAESDPELDAALQAARERLDTAARELSALHRTAGPPVGFDLQPLPIPMRLGMFLGRARADGIEIMGVTPQGPAAAAGVESGDLLTSINGYALGGSGMEAGRGLRAATRDLSPGDTVQIEYRRGDETRSAEIEVRDTRHSVAMFGAASAGPIAIGSPMPSLALGPGAGRPMGVVLHDLNPGVGRYFGVDAGILVLNGDDNPDTLMPGDVITELNGELVARQHELFAGMRAGEASVTVIRDGGSLSLSLKPGDVMGGMGFMRAVPVDAMRVIEMRQRVGEQDFEILINSDSSFVGP
ncbi:MAG: PDZ domain-containing protein [Gammaproteobacteria bacterium]|nr:MAG: PDZ domain-containing protein [Gammaproteobacteria bacterium]